MCCPSSCSLSSWARASPIRTGVWWHDSKLQPVLVADEQVVVQEVPSSCLQVPWRTPHESVHVSFLQLLRSASAHLQCHDIVHVPGAVCSCWPTPALSKAVCDLALLLLLRGAGGVDGWLHQHPRVCVTLPDRAACPGALRVGAGGHSSCGES